MTKLSTLSPHGQLGHVAEQTLMCARSLGVVTHQWNSAADVIRRIMPSISLSAALRGPPEMSGQDVGWMAVEVVAAVVVVAWSWSGPGTAVR